MIWSQAQKYLEPGSSDFGARGEVQVMLLEPGSKVYKGFESHSWLSWARLALGEGGWGGTGAPHWGEL